MLSLIIGLGNVGAAYEGTRHNVGFEVVTRLAAGWKAEAQPETGLYRWAVAQLPAQRMLLAWPTTLMNRSGWAAARLVAEHQLEPQAVLVIVDDLSLPLGRLRFRQDGSDGGHKGLASIIEHVGSERFPRLRLGIGPLPEGKDAIQLVLGRFDEQERVTVSDMISTAAEAAAYAVEHCLEEAMTKYNVNPAQS